MYRAKDYLVRPLEDVIAELEQAALYYQKIASPPRKVFICDGDALAAPTESLLLVAEK